MIRQFTFESGVLSIALAVGLSAGAAHAQENDWSYSASIYAWVPGLDATVQTPFGELQNRSSGGSVLDNLDMAFMGSFEARRARWSFLIDAVYADLSTSKDTPFGAAFSQADIETKLSAISGYALYRSYDTEKLQLDAGLGVRAFSVDLDTRFKASGLENDRTFGGDRNWALPLVAVRAHAPITDKWFVTGLVDYGQTSGDVSTWQGVATVGYQFNPVWALRAGYRYMELEQEIGGMDADLALQGPLIGLSAKF